jgi:hypothetical protein
MWHPVASTCFLQSKKLEHIQLADENQFSFESLRPILSGVDHEELNAVFQAWMPRDQEMSEGNGSYVG